jgi:hypothetical protein
MRKQGENEKAVGEKRTGKGDEGKSVNLRHLLKTIKIYISQKIDLTLLKMHIQLIVIGPTACTPPPFIPPSLHPLHSYMHACMHACRIRGLGQLSIKVSIHEKKRDLEHGTTPACCIHSGLSSPNN